jgi:hypothetical protein
LTTTRAPLVARAVAIALPIVPSCALVLEDERPRAPADFACHSLDPDEARLALAQRGLQELSDARAIDIAAEVFLDVDPHQRWPLARLLVGGRLVLLHGDLSIRVRPADGAHVHLLLARWLRGCIAGRRQAPSGVS